MLIDRQRLVGIVAVAAVLLSQGVTGQSKEGGPRGDPKRGRRLFSTTAACSGCHKANGRGGSIAPDLSHVGATREAAWLSAKIYNPRLGNPSTTMPSASELALSDNNVADLTAYLASLR